MTANVGKPTTRAEAARRRRQQQQRQRYETAARGTANVASSVRPLVSRPRPASLPAQRPPARRGLRLPSLALPQITVSWRLASLSIVVLLLALLGRLFTDPNMFLDGVNLGGSALVPGEEIYLHSGIAGQHIFWVDPLAVERQVEQVPGIADAAVSVQWPNTVTIVVLERIPVVTWIENERVWWVDADGFKFKAREELPGLLPIQVDAVEGKASQPDDTPVPAEAIHGALQLRELRPNIELLHYDAAHGLSYQDGRGWRGYFGVGTDMPQKLAVYEKLTADLTARGIYPRLISVENLGAPYYKR
jgi:hypothetical protein